MTTYGLTNGKTVFLVTSRLTFDYLYLSKYEFFIYFFKIQAEFWPCFSEIDLFGFMAPFGSSLKMILVVLSSLSFGDHFNLKTDCDPMMQRSSSANFYLMQDLVSFAPSSKTWSDKLQNDFRFFWTENNLNRKNHSCWSDQN